MYSYTSGSESYIAAKIKNKSLRRLFFGLGLLALGIAILISQQNYLANLISGPRQLDPLTLEQELVSGKIKDINVSLPLVSDNVIKSGYTHITETTDEDTNTVENTVTDGEYYLTLLGNHVLVIEGVYGQKPSGNFLGVIVPIDPSLQPKLIADFNNDPDLQDLSSKILPYMISNRGMVHLDGFWISLIGLVLLCLGAILIIRRVLNIEDSKHYIYKVADSAGYNDISQLSNDFLTANQTSLVKLGNGYKLNNKFLFKDSFFFFSIFPLSQMYGAYKKIIQRRVNFIPVGKSYALTLSFKPKKVVEVRESESKVDEHLVLLASLCPEVKFGYSANQSTIR